MLGATTVLCVALVHLAAGRMSAEQKDRARWLAAELVQDARNKIQQTEGVRQQHAVFVSFEVGYVMGQIREKYRTMLELYRVALNKLNERSFWASPAGPEYRPVHFYFKMEFVHLLEMEIDKLVDVLEHMPQTDDQPTGFRARAEDSDAEDAQERQRYRLEEQVKRRLREQYLARKLGSPAQTTAAKRFLHRWPVPGTWSGERY